jgi:hypothetical protein
MVFNPEAQAPRETQIPTPDPNAFPLGIKRVEQTNGQPIYKDTAMAEADREGKLKIDPALLTQDSNGNIYIDQSLFKPENALYRELPAEKPRISRRTKILAAVLGAGVIGAGAIGFKSMGGESTPKNPPVAAGEAFPNNNDNGGTEGIALPIEGQSEKSIDLSESNWSVVRSSEVTPYALMEYAEPLLEEKRTESFDEIVSQGFDASHPAKFFMPGEANVNESPQATYNRIVIDLRTVWNVAKEDVDQASILLARVIDPKSPDSDFDYVQNLLGDGGTPLGAPAKVVDHSAPFYTNYSDLIESNGQPIVIMSVHEREANGSGKQVNQYGVQWVESDSYKGWVTKLAMSLADKNFDEDLANLELKSNY